MINATQLEESEALWQTILAKESAQYPFYTHAWHTTWKKMLSPSARVVVYHTEDVLLPLVITENTAHLSGGEEIADYLDAIGDTHKKKLFWEQILPRLKEDGIKRLSLRNVPASSPTNDILSALGATSLVEDMTPMMTLPGTVEEFLTTLERKDRHELKRKIKKFDLAYADARVVISDAVDISVFLDLMKKDADKKIFLTKEMELFFLSLPTISGVRLLQANLETVDHVVISSVLFFVVDKTLLLYNSGFDTDYQGSGFYLKAKTILWAIENGYKTYDFLQGQERYKYELGAKDFSVYKLEIAL